MDSNEHIIKERFEVSKLLECYGSLLTDKQVTIMNFYYNEDLSLSEIAELNETSRQAIYDLLKRCIKILTKYESRLNFLIKTELVNEKNNKLKQIVKEIDLNIENKEYDHLKENISNLKDLIIE